MLDRMQRRAAIWILRVFKTSPSFGIKAITELIPINLHFQKLSGRLQLRSHFLPHNHILQSLMEPKTLLSPKLHSLSLGFLSKCQRELIKGPVVDIDNCFNEIFPSFNPLNPEFALGCRIINNFSSYFLFNLANAMMIISNHKFINLLIWLSSLWVIPPICLLLWMLASRTTLLLLYFISTFRMNSSPRLYIMLLTSQVLKPNYLLLDVVSTRLPTSLASPKSLLLWI